MMNGNANAISETKDLIRKMAFKLALATEDESTNIFELKTRVAFLSQAVMKLEELQSDNDREGFKWPMSSGLRS